MFVSDLKATFHYLLVSPFSFMHAGEAVDQNKHRDVCCSCISKNSYRVSNNDFLIQSDGLYHGTDGICSLNNVWSQHRSTLRFDSYFAFGRRDRRGWASKGFNAPHTYMCCTAVKSSSTRTRSREWPLQEEERTLVPQFVSHVVHANIDRTNVTQMQWRLGFATCWKKHRISKSNGKAA